MQKLSSSKFTIGADATAAAGPVGRNATAQTDAYMSRRDSIVVALAWIVRRRVARWRHPAQRSGREQDHVRAVLDGQGNSGQRSENTRWSGKTGIGPE